MVEKRKLPLVGSAILLYVATKMLISIPFRESNAATSLIPNSFHLAHPVLWIWRLIQWGAKPASIEITLMKEASWKADLCSLIQDSIWLIWFSKNIFNHLLISFSRIQIWSISVKKHSLHRVRVMHSFCPPHVACRILESSEFTIIYKWLNTVPGWQHLSSVLEVFLHPFYPWLPLSSGTMQVLSLYHKQIVDILPSLICVHKS
jgi:hypothetical protein